ncbi:MAG: hypothetical protein D6824_03750 [Planctomycetota bacterium]|nr:MAG: hypothetical protein D6824_03750 [Planctomycetota bacterium]
MGLERFARELGLSTRQVNRIRSGAQPNPLERLLRCLQACTPEAGDEALAWLCQEAGGYFVRPSERLDEASVAAVRECAEAIAAISDGRISRTDEREIREAVAALMALLLHVRTQRRAHAGAAEIVVPPPALGPAPQGAQPNRR